MCDGAPCKASQRLRRAHVARRSRRATTPHGHASSVFQRNHRDRVSVWLTRTYLGDFLNTTVWRATPSPQGLRETGMAQDVVYDFHMHTILSDGDLTAIELIRRCIVNGYAGMAIADHCGAGTLERVIRENEADCALAREYWDFEAYAAVELTHVPAASIADLARHAKEVGAALVVVHGESPVEPVEPGTNLAAASCPDVDILAHPGLVSTEVVEAARDHEVYIEITARQGHGMANGFVARAAIEAGAKLIVDSDTHSPRDILTPEWAWHVARCAGIPEDMLAGILVGNAHAVLQRARANRIGARGQ